MNTVYNILLILKKCGIRYKFILTRAVPTLRAVKYNGGSINIPGGKNCERNYSPLTSTITVQTLHNVNMYCLHGWDNRFIIYKMISLPAQDVFRCIHLVIPVIYQKLHFLLQYRATRNIYFSSSELTYMTEIIFYLSHKSMHLTTVRKWYLTFH